MTQASTSSQRRHGLSSDSEIGPASAVVGVMSQAGACLWEPPNEPRIGVPAPCLLRLLAFRYISRKHTMLYWRETFGSVNGNV